MINLTHGRRSPALGGIAISIVLVLSGCSKGVSDRNIKTIPMGDAARLHARTATDPQAALFIDPRSSGDYAREHIAGARSLQLSQVDAQRGADPAIARYENLIVYGDDPGSAVARAMTKRLMVAGYKRKKVKWFSGGLAAWRSASLPTEGSGESPSD